MKPKGRYIEPTKLGDLAPRLEGAVKKFEERMAEVGASFMAAFPGSQDFKEFVGKVQGNSYDKTEACEECGHPVRRRTYVVPGNRTVTVLYTYHFCESVKRRNRLGV